MFDPPKGFFDPPILDINMETGIVMPNSGIRTIMMDEMFILGLQKMVEDFTGESGGFILYHLGYWWSRKHHEMTLTPTLKRLGFNSVDEMPEEAYSVAMDKSFARAGFGRVEVEEGYKKDKEMFEIKLSNSAYAGIVGNIGRPACHLYAGMFAAYFEDFVGHELGVIETKCLSTGDDYCLFVAGPRKKIKAARFWKSHGMTSKDFAKKIK